MSLSRAQVRAILLDLSLHLLCDMSHELDDGLLRLFGEHL